MKYLKDTKTGSVYILSDPLAEEAIAKKRASEITREEYAEVMERRADKYVIGAAIEKPRVVTIKIAPRVADMFFERMAKEGLERRFLVEAIEKLVEEYAFGALLSRPKKPLPENAYLKDHRA